MMNQGGTFPKISHTVQYLEVPDWETSWHRTIWNIYIEHMEIHGSYFSRS